VTFQVLSLEDRDYDSKETEKLKKHIEKLQQDLHGK
jgi:hypothetical protein